MRLSDSEVQRWDEDGFLAIERFIEDDVVADLRAAYDDVLGGLVPAQGDRMLGGRTRQVMWPSQAHVTFQSNAALDAGHEIARQLLGSAGFLFDMLIYKPPNHPEETPWHQDMSYSRQPFAPAGVKIPLSTIQFWIALDDADEENGCMQFVPGYHKQPLMEHRVAGQDPGDDSRLLELVDPEAQLDLSRVEAKPLRAGGATIHSYGTPHYTPPNRSSHRPRRAYIFNLIATNQT
jgi:ectoine hydroxylase-related dioxygenase (phytanoyl-CoA dioxygenase family)